MAKKRKVSDKAGMTTSCPGVDYSPTLYIDFDDLKEIRGLAVGDEITVVVKGKVRSVEQRESYEDPKKVRSSVSLTNFEAEIVNDDNQFADLMDEDD